MLPYPEDEEPSFIITRKGMKLINCGVHKCNPFLLLIALPFATDKFLVFVFFNLLSDKLKRKTYMWSFV